MTQWRRKGTCGEMDIHEEFLLAHGCFLLPFSLGTECLSLESGTSTANKR